MDPQPFSQIDAYRIWLSIPVEECPPNHYRLLGLKPLEDDAKVIQNAADRQMGYLRTKQTGPHSAYSQQLLNEVSLAAGRLLNLETKAAYDAQLSAVLFAPTPECKATADFAKQPLTFPLDLNNDSSHPLACRSQTLPARSNRQAKNPLVEMIKIVAGGFGGLAAAALFLWSIGKFDAIENLYSSAFGAPSVAKKPAEPDTSKSAPSEFNQAKELRPHERPNPQAAADAIPSKPTVTVPAPTAQTAPPQRPPLTPVPAVEDESANPQSPRSAAPPTPFFTPLLPNPPAIQPAAILSPIPLPPEVPPRGIVPGSPAAVRESLEFSGRLYDYLQTHLTGDDRREDAATFGRLVQDILAGRHPQVKIPVVESGVADFSRHYMTFGQIPVAKTRAYRTGELRPDYLASHLLPKPPSPGQLTHLYRGPSDPIPEALDAWTVDLHRIAAQCRQNNELPAADALTYLTCLGRALRHSYERQYLNQWSVLFPLDAQLTTARAQIRNSNCLHESFTAHRKLLGKFDLMTKATGNYDRDLRQSFIAGRTSFARQPDGTWLEKTGEQETRHQEENRTETSITLLHGGTRTYLNLRTYYRSAAPHQVWGSWRSGSGSVAPTQPQLPPAAPPTVPAVGGERRLWVHSSGYFWKQPDGKWLELVMADYWRFQEVSSTADYIELERPEGGTRVRLYYSRCEVAFGGGPYRKFYDGRFVKPFNPRQVGAELLMAKRACETYDQQLKEARKKLIESFESGKRVTRQRPMNAEAKIELIATLAREQTRFEKEGLIPWSLPMRVYSANYLSAINKARGQAETALDKAIDSLVRSNEEATVETVRALKLQTLAPLTIARLECKVTRGGDWTFTNRLHSNGTVNLPHTNSWTTAPGILHLHVSSPAKIYRDRLVLAEDGKSFKGTSNNDKEFAGHFADQLLPQDVGPDRLSLLR